MSVRSHPRALSGLALGTASTIAFLLCIPDAFALLPNVPNAFNWCVRMAGLWLSAFILWFISFLAVLRLVGLLGGGVLVNSNGIKLWRLGRLIPWSNVVALAVEPQPTFSRLFNLKPVASRIIIYEQKKPGAGLIGHQIPSFGFLPEDFKLLLDHICQASFNLVPDAPHVAIFHESERPALKKSYERRRIVSAALTVFIAVSLVMFLGRRAMVNYAYNSGNQHFRHKRYAEAKRHYETAVSVDPTFALGWDQLARCEFRLGDKKNAEIHWVKALYMRPDHVEAKVGLSNIYMNQGKLDEAIRLLEQSIRLQPRSSAAFINLAYVYLKAGDSRRAISVAEKVPIDTNDPELIASWANLMLKLKEHGRAGELARRALALDSKNALALQVLNQLTAQTQSR